MHSSSGLDVLFCLKGDGLESSPSHMRGGPSFCSKFLKQPANANLRCTSACSLVRAGEAKY